MQYLRIAAAEAEGTFRQLTVSEDYHVPFKFTGTIPAVETLPGDETITAADQKAIEQAASNLGFSDQVTDVRCWRWDDGGLLSNIRSYNPAFGMCGGLLVSYSSNPVSPVRHPERDS